MQERIPLVDRDWPVERSHLDPQVTISPDKHAAALLLKRRRILLLVLARELQVRLEVRATLAGEPEPDFKVTPCAQAIAKAEEVANNLVELGIAKIEDSPNGKELIYTRWGK